MICMDTLRHFTTFSRRTIESRTNELVSEWVSDWCMKDRSVQVTAAEYFGEDYSLVYFTLGDKVNDTVAVNVDSLDVKSLLFDVEADEVPDDEVCEHILEAAMNDLLSNLVFSIKGNPTQETLHRASKVLAQPGSFSARHCLSATRIILTVAIDDHDLVVVFPLGSAGKIDNTERDGRKRVLSKLDIKDISRSVPLRISLDFGKHSISDIYDLELNDILVSGSPISIPLSIAIDGQKIASAYLGKSKNKKSVLLTK